MKGTASDVACRSTDERSSTGAAATDDLEVVFDGDGREALLVGGRGGKEKEDVEEEEDGVSCVGEVTAAAAAAAAERLRCWTFS